MSSERVLPLDSLRGLAALGVTLFWHYGHFGPDRPFDGAVAVWLYRYGLILVDFFFVLSGFVLSHVYLEKVRQRRVRPFGFFVFRFSRLYPLHFATLLFVAVVQLVRSSIGLGFFVYEANDVFHFLLNLGFIQFGIIKTTYSFNGPAWSLSIEELSYFAFFVAVFFFSARYRIAFALLLLLGIAIDLGSLDTHLFNLEVARGLLGFFSGCFTYQLQAIVRRRNLGPVVVPGTLLLLMGFALYAWRVGYVFLPFPVILHSLVVFPAIVLAALNSAWLTRALSVRPLVYCGEISYSIYMIHFPVQLVLVTLDETFELGLPRASVPFFFGYAAITLALSSASYRLFERPVQAAIRGALGSGRAASGRASS